MKKLLFIFGLVLLASSAHATDIYFAATSAGSNNGTSCANAYAYNDGTHGWNISGQQVAGNTLHACGTIVFSTNTVALNIINNGTSGNPITFKMETGAILQSQSFPGNPGNGSCPSLCGGVEAINRQYIVLDGGSNGIVQNTLTGASSKTCIAGPCQDAPSGGSVGVFASGSHNIIRNFTLNNIYISCGATNCTDNNAAEDNTAGIRVDGGSTSTYICNNSASQAYIGISTDTADVTQTATIATSCASSSAPTGTDIFQNTLVNNCHHIQPTGQGGVNIWFNDISAWTDWIWPGTGNGCHTDGMISFSDGATLMNINVYDNYIHGDLGLGSPTGFIFCTYNGSNGGSSCTAFNNLLIGTGSMTTGNDAIVYVHSNGGSPMKYYNNTTSQGGYAYDMDGDSTTHMTFENNIYMGDSGGDTWAWHQESSGQAWSTLTFTNFNIFYNMRSAGAWNWNNTIYSTLANWVSGCKSNTGGGAGTCDDASITSNPNLNSSYVPNSGSPAIHLAANLTSLGITPLDEGAPQFFGVGGNCGTGCVARPSSGAWDSGAYPFAASTPSITTTSLPNGVQFVPYSHTVTATGGVTPYTWSVSVGSLPTGLTLNSSTGTISGTPTVIATSSFTIKVTDNASNTATQPLSIVIVAPVMPVAIQPIMLSMDYTRSENYG